MYRSVWWVEHGIGYVVTATYMQRMNGDGADGLCHCIGSGEFIASPGVDTILSGICICFKYNIKRGRVRHW